ncbi:penicillin acylase family protein [Ascidiimonas aurantiaca]|uniref:penicillin acylase family protein n=1 Tax=Ascidiimonas aurantiaca TaxID=1685432 RepID=UPI0030ECB31D
MKKININFLFPLLALVILIFLLSSQMFNIFPLGQVLNPFSGVVHNGDISELTEPKQVFKEIGLEDSVTVFLDDRKVPHIYARNLNDLYMAQGYVTASLRLWQMEFMTYASGGRLAELFEGERILNMDRAQRRLGILEAAKRSLAVMEKDPETMEALHAYTKGVNAFIKRLSYKNMPLEYKILGYEPEPWTNLKSVLILKGFADKMTGYGEDVFQSKMLLALGEKDFNLLFPDVNPKAVPVMPGDLYAGGDSLQAAFKKPAYLDYAFLKSGTVQSKEYNPRLGSNSWAVSGAKTTSGNPILACDPHLNFSLPNIWLEMQLSAPGMNVYGVSIPGAPAIIIGFNEDIAWGVTNGADDVKDWYKLIVSEDYKQYMMDGKWYPLESRIETIKRKGGSPVIDTVYHSVHGPLVADKKFHEVLGEEVINYALKWELHTPSNEFRTFIRLNKAKNYADFKEAIATYVCPSQNFTYAGKDQTIAIHHQGKIAKRERGHGRFILDGTSEKYIVKEYIPFDSLPQIKNPDSQYVLSANQTPAFSNGKYNYSGYFSETRARRINELLNNENQFDILKTQQIQLDATNLFATETLTHMVDMIIRDELDEKALQYLNAIEKWKGTYTLNDEMARLFELWWDAFRSLTWDELKQYDFYLRPPDNYVLANLLENQAQHRFFDVIATEVKEDASQLLTRAFVKATEVYEELAEENTHTWDAFNQVSLPHLTGIPFFGRSGIATSGHPDAINAMSPNWGPVWRMVVEIGTPPKAYGIHAGGQSGKIGSPYYDNFLDDWQKGKYYELLFFTSEQDAEKRTSSKWSLSK